MSIQECVDNFGSFADDQQRPIRVQICDSLVQSQTEHVFENVGDTIQGLRQHMIQVSVEASGGVGAGPSCIEEPLPSDPFLSPFPGQQDHADRSAHSSGTWPAIAASGVGCTEAGAATEGPCVLYQLSVKTTLQSSMLQIIERIAEFTVCSHIGSFIEDDIASEGEGGSGLSDCDMGEMAAMQEGRQGDIFRGLHSTLRIIEQQGLFSEILDVESQLAGAPLIFNFLLDVVMSRRGGWRKAAVDDLKLVLRLPSWAQMFSANENARRKLDSMTSECRYLLGFQTTADASTPVVQGDRVNQLALNADASPWTLSEIDEEHSRKVEEKVKESLCKVGESICERGARIVIMGNAGVGKSSCINAAFHRDLAKTGAGISVTSCVQHYEATSECPIHIYDTKGFEATRSNDDVLQQLQELLAERQLAASQYSIDDPFRVAEKLHAVWWVIDIAGGGRFDPALMNLVQAGFAQQDLPIIIVLNKCDVCVDSVELVRQSVWKHCPWAAAVVEVVADPRLGPIMQRCEHCRSSDIVISSRHKYYNCDSCGKERVPFRRCYGFDDLIRVTAEHLPDMVMLSLLTSQREWIEGLDRSALNVIVAHSLAAAGFGATPLPFLSRFVLFPSQMLMVGQLASIYEVLLSTKTKVHIIVSVGGVFVCGGLACLAANFLKAVPGLNVAGMVSDAAISAAFTAAMGLTVRELFRRVRGKALAGEVKPEDLASVMPLDEMRSSFNAYLARISVPLQELVTDFQSMSAEELRRLLDETPC